jgi:surfeit locus 1 family protein
MKLFFRPLPLLTLFFVPALALCVGLGVWQIERLHWKVGLIAEMSAHMKAAPITVDDAIALGKDAEYRRVALDGHFDNAKESYVFTTINDGDAAYHVVAPFVLDDGRVLLVDRGYVTPELRPVSKREAGEISGETHIEGIWRTPDPPGIFTPAPDLAQRVWYSRDLKSIAKAGAITPAAAVIVEADAAPNPGGWPKGGQTRVNLPNDHMQYAITWFGLALGLFAIYLAYHQAQGRLGFRP